MNKLNGHSLAGTSTTRERVQDDFYATPEESTLALLAVENIVYPALEPACGAGHIARLLKDGQVTATDLVYRGYGTGGLDFLVGDFFKDSVATIITNPPFNLFQEFAEKALSVATNKVILFGKLQALEGKKRATWMQSSPLRTVYVFKGRQNPLRDGNPLNENGKPWSNTMAFAWFVWEIGYSGKPTIEWL
jgi:hypothetical protein